MGSSVLVAGIGNIFQGDDAFGIAVIQKLAALSFADSIRVMDVGIRSLDLAFALLDQYDLAILVDATARAGAPGTLYTIEIEPDDISDASDEGSVVNSHSLDPVRVLALAKSMGARFRKLLLVGCEPLVVDHDESGTIGLSEVVEAAVDPAVERIRQLIEEFTGNELKTNNLKKEEVCSHECI